MDAKARVREGMIRVVGDCKVFVFRYPGEGKSAEAFEHATTRLSVSPKFMSRTLHGNRYSMVGRDKELVVIHQTGRYIAIVIGQDQDKVKSTSDQLVQKLKRG